ncbi:MAG: sulfatase [Planctomycetota bacterium]
MRALLTSRQPLRRFALLLALVLAGCAPAAPRRNLILISIDTLRADRLGCYGYSRPTTPFLDAQARQGVLFRDANAVSSWTFPSHAAMFTGLYPGRSGATELKRPIRPEVPALAEWLAARGYETGAVVSSTLFKGYGLERGFETLALVDPGGPEPSRVTAESLAWLKARAGEQAHPFFFLIHYLDPHSDYSSLPEFETLFREPYEGKADGTSEQLFRHVSGSLHYSAADARHLSNLYDAGVRQQDAELAQLFAYLDSAGFLANSVVVLTSDHGEEFLEHGGVMHGLQQYEESVRIPLLFFGPDVPAGVEVVEPVSQVDLVPTVLELLGLEAPGELDGISLVPLWRAPTAARPARALLIEGDRDPPGPTASVMITGDDLALRRGNWKLFFDPTRNAQRLYDLATDPREERDVAGEHPELVRELADELARLLARRVEGGAAAPLDAHDLELLRMLGYAGDEPEGR